MIPQRSVKDGQVGVATAGRAMVRQLQLLTPGVGLAIILAGVATALGHTVPVVGAPVFAIVSGVTVSLLRPIPAGVRPGLCFAGKAVLQGSIVVLGTALSFRQVITTGSSSVPTMIGSLAIALVGAALIGRFMGIGRDLRTLIGVGTAICGASAIAATDAVISATEADVSYSIATIFTFNIAAVLTFPSLGHLLGMTPHGFGQWAGTAINDMSSVVAAGSVFGHGATSTAIVVKLTRTLMIIPITLVISFWRSRQGPIGSDEAPRRSLRAHVLGTFPVFIGWFLLAVSLNTVGLVPQGWHPSLSILAQFMIATALAAIGLSTKVADIRRAGMRPLALGGVLWVLVGAASLCLQSLSGGIR
jgi:uncharacterized integral membrane protein (TIGR00698 family)